MAKDQGLYTGLVFVDMSKAFDRVEHQTLINDLSNIGVRGSALKWFINYLTDRQQQVRCGNTVSGRLIPVHPFSPPALPKQENG